MATQHYGLRFFLHRCILRIGRSIGERLFLKEMDMNMCPDIPAKIVGAMMSNVQGALAC